MVTIEHVSALPINMATKNPELLFDFLKAGLEEGIAHAHGELTLKTVEIPEEPPEIGAARVIEPA